MGQCEVNRSMHSAWPMTHDLKIPIVRFVDGTGGGGSVKFLSNEGYTYVPVNPAWDLVVANLGRIPVVEACLGSVAGLGAARVVTAHFSLMVESNSQVMVAGPPVVKFGTGEDLTKEELGGVLVHKASGVVDNVVKSDGMESVRSPFRTAEVFGIEEIIDSRETRPLLCEWVKDAYALLPELLGPYQHAMRP